MTHPTAARHPRAGADPTRSEVGVIAAPAEVLAVLTDTGRYREWLGRASGTAGAPVATSGGVVEIGTRDARLRFEVEPSATGSTVVLHSDATGPRERTRDAGTLWRLKAAVEGGADRAAEPGSSALAAASVPAPVANAVARVFGGLSAARRARVFHPRGIAFAGTAELHGAGTRLAGSANPDVVVRVSRGLGVRHPLPDFNGVAVKFLDAHGPGRDQDLLLVSALRRPVARHVLVPVPTFASTGTSSILPYRSPDGLVMFGAEPLPEPDLAGLEGALPFPVRLLLAPLAGRWAPIGELRLTERLGDDVAGALRFDPWHTGADLVPATFLNRLRLAAYAASQAARPERPRS